MIIDSLRAKWVRLQSGFNSISIVIDTDIDIDMVIVVRSLKSLDIAGLLITCPLATPLAAYCSYSTVKDDSIPRGLLRLLSLAA